MRIAEELRAEGLGTPEFTKEQLMESIKRKIRDGKSAIYIVGRHAQTDLSGHAIGTCNPYNRKYLLKWLAEEGLCWEFSTNSYGVESMTITL